MYSYSTCMKYLLSKVFLGLKLQTTVSHHVRAGNQTQVLCRSKPFEPSSHLARPPHFLPGDTYSNCSEVNRERV